MLRIVALARFTSLRFGFLPYVRSRDYSRTRRLLVGPFLRFFRAFRFYSGNAGTLHSLALFALSRDLALGLSSPIPGTLCGRHFL